MKIFAGLLPVPKNHGQNTMGLQDTAGPGDCPRDLEFSALGPWAQGQDGLTRACPVVVILVMPPSHRQAFLFYFHFQYHAAFASTALPPRFTNTGEGEMAECALAVCAAAFAGTASRPPLRRCETARYHLTVTDSPDTVVAAQIVPLQVLAQALLLVAF